MNHLLYNRLGQYSIILYIFLSSICVHCLANVASSKGSVSLIHCLLVTVYVWYFIQRKCKWLVQHLISKPWECLCNCFKHVPCYKNTCLDEIKGEYSISHASNQAYFVSLVACKVRRLSGPWEAYMYTDVTDHLLNKWLATTYSLGVLLRLVPLVVQ